MPLWLLNPTVWKFAGIALLVTALTVTAIAGIHHYENLKAQAALVPGLQKANAELQKQAARDESRAAQAAIDLVQAQAARDQAVKDYEIFRSVSAKIGTTLQDIASHAQATVNPVCLPSDAERELFNATVARYSAANPASGSGGASGAVPTRAN